MNNFEKEKMLEAQAVKERINRNLGIYATLIRLDFDEEVRGVDDNLIAVIVMERRPSGYAVGIEYESRDGDGYFTHVHRTLVNTVDDAVKFFDGFGVGEVSWLKVA